MNRLLMAALLSLCPACIIVTGGPSCTTQMCGGICCQAGTVCVVGPSGGQECLQSCTSSSQCANPNDPSCAPATDGAGNPIGPMVCKPNDGLPYDGCRGVSCGAGHCCYQDGSGNDFCASPCESGASCGGGAQCHAWSDIDGQCAQPGACGP